MIKILNLKLVVMLEYQTTKTFLLQDILQIGQKKFLCLKKLKILFHGHMLLMKKLLEHFMKKDCRNQTKKNSIEEVIKTMGNKLYVK